MSIRSRIVVAAVVLASLVQPLSAQRGNSVPSVSSRPPDFIYKVTAGAALPSLGWKIGVPIGALKAGSFAEAAGMVDRLQLGYFEATPAELPYTLDETALAAPARRIQELRLGLSAYYVAQLPEGAERIRQLFEFARRLNIETIIASPERAALADLDALATVFSREAPRPARARYGAFGNEQRGAPAGPGIWTELDQAGREGSRVLHRAGTHADIVRHASPRRTRARGDPVRAR